MVAVQCLAFRLALPIMTVAGLLSFVLIVSVDSLGFGVGVLLYGSNGR